MATLSSRLFDLPVIPWSDTANPAFSVIQIVVSSVGIVGTVKVTSATSLVIFAIVCNKKTPSIILILVILCVDFLLCLYVAIIGIVNQIYGGWSVGIGGCLVSYVIGYGGCIASVNSIAALALERFRSVIYGIRLDNKTALLWAILSSASATVLVLLPVMTMSYRDSIKLATGNAVCTLDWTSRLPIVIAQSIFCLAYLAIVFAFIAVVYFKIVRKYFEIQTQINSAHGNSMPSKRFGRSEKKLLIKAVVFAGSFIISWSPYSFSMFIQLVTGNEISGWFDGFCTLCVICNSVADPFILVFLDSRVKSYTFKLFGIEKKKSESDSKSKSSGVLAASSSDLNSTQNILSISGKGSEFASKSSQLTALRKSSDSISPSKSSEILSLNQIKEFE